MKQKRAISITDRAEAVLETFESSLLREGHPPALVEQFASELYEIIFERLPRGSLRNWPGYLGLDPHRDGYSLYFFAESGVLGTYSSCGNHVILYTLSIEPHPVSAALGITAA